MKNKIPLVSPTERANFENNKKLFYDKREEFIDFLGKQGQVGLTSLFIQMFGGKGSHRRLYDPETNAWRSAFRASRRVVDIQ